MPVYNKLHYLSVNLAILESTVANVVFIYVIAHIVHAINSSSCVLTLKHYFPYLCFQAIY